MNRTSPSAGLFRNFDRLFEDAFTALNACDTRPRPEIFHYTRDEDYVLRVELPGFRKEDVQLSVEKDILTVKAEAEDAASVPQANFERSFTLPDDVEQERITANFKDGILTLTLPKTEPTEPKVRTIEIL